MRAFSSGLPATRMPRRRLLAILAKKDSIKLSQDPCFGVNTNSNRLGMAIHHVPMNMTIQKIDRRHKADGAMTNVLMVPPPARVRFPEIETRDRDGIQQHLSPAAFGGLPVNGHHFSLGRRPANLLLEGQNRRFHRSGIHRFEHTREARPTGGRNFTLAIAADPQRSPLAPAHLPGKLRQILRPTRGFAQIGQRDNRQQTPYRIRLNA